MVYLVDIAICSINQWALDFKGNKRRILETIDQAKQAGCRYRSGPELELCGYSCQDHFLEPDTESHCWEILADIIEESPNNMIIDVGLPVCHRGVRYNCRLIFLNSRILLIRPKTVLANEANYREQRWFSPWTKTEMDAYELPACVQKICRQNQKSAPFGVAMLKLQDNVRIGYEICEELWRPKSIGIAQCLSGADIIFNSSASHHSLYKFNRRAGLIASASYRGHCFYYFSNMQGCDGDRLLFDGGCILARNGDFLKIGERFSLEEVSVMTSRIDLDEIRAARSSIGSRQAMASLAEKFNEINVGNFQLQVGGSSEISPTNSLARSINARRGSVISINTSNDSEKQSLDLVPESAEKPTLCCQPCGLNHLDPEQEICQGGPMVWLFDYLRRSGMSGYILPLSGGIDSAATACIVYGLALKMYDNLMLNEVQNLLNQINCEVKKIRSAKDIMRKLLHTIYLPNKGCSSSETEKLAANLAKEIGSTHIVIPISNLVENSIKNLPDNVKEANFAKPGFDKSKRWHQKLAMENLQARTRMLTTYLAASTVDDGHGKLVLASSNADECLTGYLTKYDCSSGDVNPIGAISKEDLKSVVHYMSKKFNIKPLQQIYQAKPSAELKPLDSSTGKFSQTDEEDMGLTYIELERFGKLRIEQRCGPLSMYQKLVAYDSIEKSDEKLKVAEKVKKFFTRYAKNRHKMTVMTPSVHADSYSPDDNRHDLRPFLMNVNFDWQFERMFECAKK